MILALFHHPGRVIHILAFTRSPLIPILVVALLYGALKLTTLPEIIATYDSPEFRTEYLKSVGTNIEQGEKALKLMKDYAAVWIFVEAPILIAGSVIMTAFVLFLAGRTFFRERIVLFRPIMGMVAWAGMITLIPLILGIILWFINPGLKLPTNAAYFLPMELQKGYYGGVLSAIDLFFIWQAAVIAIGVSKLFVISINQAVTLVGTICVVFAILYGISIEMAV